VGSHCGARRERAPYLKFDSEGCLTIRAGGERRGSPGLYRAVVIAALRLSGPASGNRAEVRMLKVALTLSTIIVMVLA